MAINKQFFNEVNVAVRCKTSVMAWYHASELLMEMEPIIGLLVIC